MPDIGKVAVPYEGFCKKARGDRPERVVSGWTLGRRWRDLSRGCRSDVSGTLSGAAVMAGMPIGVPTFLSVTWRDCAGSRTEWVALAE